jgi:ATP-binding cassette subfamily B protein
VSKIKPKLSRTEQVLREFHEEKDLGSVFDRHLLKRLWPFLSPHRTWLVVSMLLLVAMALTSLVRPLIMRRAFELTDASNLRTSGILLLIVLIVEQVISFAQWYALQIVGVRATYDLRSAVFAFLHRQRLAFFDKQPIGRLVTRVTNDTDAVGELFASGALNVVGDIIKLSGIVLMMLMLDLRMSLVAFALVPPVAILVEVVRRYARVSFREIRVKLARLNAFLSEQVQGISVVQSYCREEQEAREFDKINRAYRNANFKAITLEAILDAAIEMISSVCIASIVWYAGGRKLGDGVSFGLLVAFVAYIEQFFGPIRDLSSRYTLLQSALSGAERIFQLLDMTEQDAPILENTSDGDPSYAFDLDDVGFEYRTDLPVLSHVTIRAKPGEKIAIVGPTGSGKSTVASILLRLYDVKSGAIRVNGRDIRAMSRDELRANFALVPQELYLFRGTIASNVAAGHANVDRTRVEEVLRRVGAGELIDSRDGGIDAKVDERGTNLSAGQRQLIAFARAMYRSAPILVLDEATASVDSQTEARLQSALHELFVGKTALIIAHRLSTIRSADRIVVLHHGKVVEQGKHDELVALGGLYARLHRLQVATASTSSE